jgi:hypothetical protein
MVVSTRDSFDWLRKIDILKKSQFFVNSFAMWYLIVITGSAAIDLSLLFLVYQIEPKGVRNFH